MNPTYLVFVSLLHVENKYRKRGFGRLILWLLQYMYLMIFKHKRILVWITRAENSSDKGTPGNSHILFYRKLGFYPSNPLHLPLEQMVPSELVKSMRDAIDPNTVGTSCKEFVGECSQEVSLSNVMIEQKKCCSCFMEGPNILIECKLKSYGLKMCIMCYSQFGVNIGNKRCVFHIKNYL